MLKDLYQRTKYTFENDRNLRMAYFSLGLTAISIFFFEILRYESNIILSFFAACSFIGLFTFTFFGLYYGIKGLISNYKNRKGDYNDV